MTEAEAYLDRLYDDWKWYQNKLDELNERPDKVDSLVHSLFSRLTETAATRYYAAKHMMELMQYSSKQMMELMQEGAI